MPHRQYVFTVPRLLRPIFARRRERLELLCRYIPDRYEHPVRYVGWYCT